jgi:hypothetical protein
VPILFVYVTVECLFQLFLRPPRPRPSLFRFQLLVPFEKTFPLLLLSFSSFSSSVG